MSETTRALDKMRARLDRLKELPAAEVVAFAERIEALLTPAPCEGDTPHSSRLGRALARESGACPKCAASEPPDASEAKHV